MSEELQAGVFALELPPKGTSREEHSAGLWVGKGTDRLAAPGEINRASRVLCHQDSPIPLH